MFPVRIAICQWTFALGDTSTDNQIYIWHVYLPKHSWIIKLDMGVFITSMCTLIPFFLSLKEKETVQVVLGEAKIHSSCSESWDEYLCCLLGSIEGNCQTATHPMNHSGSHESLSLLCSTGAISFFKGKKMVSEAHMENETCPVDFDFSSTAPSIVLEGILGEF